MSNLSYQYKFSVSTPTFNRAHTLHRVYESLKAQTYSDFEWLIVDDGSTDNTRDIVENWQKQAGFPIRYLHQENSGKHIAINRGVKEAKGELFLIFDSDDGCIPEALERFKYYWDTIPENIKNSFSAVTSLCKKEDGSIVGTYFPFNITDSDSLEMRYRFKVKGEKWGFHRVDVLRQFPFPEVAGVKFISEGIVWSRIARKYKTRFVNEALRIYYSGNDQLTKSVKKIPAKHSLGATIGYLITLNESIDWFYSDPLIFLKCAIQYSRFSFHAKTSLIKQFKKLESSLGKLLWMIAFPLGYIFYLKDIKSVIGNG